jgi:hypothetical protein
LRQFSVSVSRADESTFTRPYDNSIRVQWNVNNVYR